MNGLRRFCLCRRQAALTSLEAAHQDLESAAADKGGHRGNAMKLVAQAIEETKAGIELDKTH